MSLRNFILLAGIGASSLIYAASPSVTATLASLVLAGDEACVLPNSCAGKKVGGVCACAGAVPQTTTCSYECSKSGNVTAGLIACDDTCKPVGCSVADPCTSSCGKPGLLVCAPRPNSPPRIVCKIVNDIKLCFPVWSEAVCYDPKIPAEVCNGVDDNCDGYIDELVCRASTSCTCVPKKCEDIKAKGKFPDGCGGEVEC